MNRTKTRLSPEIGEALVKQIAHELSNHTLYMSFAAFFSRNGLVDLEKYYRKRAMEEFHHNEWISTFLIDGDYEFVYPAIARVENNIDNLNVPFALTTTREIQTTQMLYAIYELALQQKDYMTATWLFKTLLLEQNEEEDLARMAESIAELECDWLLKAEKIYELIEG